MSPVRRFVDDLVEKRLWPVVLLLVVALVAIPVVIGGSSADGGDAADVTALAAPDLASSATPAVELVGPPAVRSRPGKLRDPFRRSKRKEPAKKSSSKSSPSKSSAAKAGSSAKGGATTGGAKSGSGTSSSPSAAKPKPAVTVPVEPKAAAVARSVYETTVHVTGPSRDYEHPLDRLAVIGDKDSPAAQYLGTSRGGEYAIFLLGPTATATGRAGACIVAEPCRAIGVRKGEKLSVVVSDSGAPTRRYTIEVTSLRRVTRASAAAAERERKRVAEDGREVLRTIAEDVPTAAALSQLRYGPATGTVTLISSS